MVQISARFVNFDFWAVRLVGDSYGDTFLNAIIQNIYRSYHFDLRFSSLCYKFNIWRFLTIFCALCKVLRRLFIRRWMRFPSSSTKSRRRPPAVTNCSAQVKAKRWPAAKRLTRALIDLTKFFVFQNYYTKHFCWKPNTAMNSTFNFSLEWVPLLHFSFGINHEIFQ